MGRVIQVVGAIWAIIGVLDIIEGLNNIGPGHPTLGAIALTFNFVLFIIPGLGLCGLGELVVRKRKSRLQASSEGQARKKCPECAELVQPEAKICRFCQHRFTDVEQPSAEPSALPSGPPCPKCARANTFSYMQKVDASSWWKQAKASFIRCRDCDATWQAENSRPSESLKEGVLALGIVCLVAGLIALALIAPKPGSSTNVPTASTRADSIPTSSNVSPNLPQSNWHTEESTNSMDGTKTTIIINDHGESSIVVRFRGSHLDAYVTTPEMVGYDDTGVRVRFDNSEPINQSWTRSEDYKGLFCSDPRWLVAKLQKAKKFYIEYHPYEKVPETLSFDVDGLVVPRALLDTYDSERQRQHSAWLKKFDACMEEQRELFTDQADRESYCKATTH